MPGSRRRCWPGLRRSQGHDGSSLAIFTATELAEARNAAKADLYFHDGVAYCEDHDLATYYNCLRGVRTSALERLGALGRVGGNRA